MDHISLRLEFSTDKFKLTGPLPEDANAGNQFYGKDFAKWICEALPLWKLDFLDEDWGWYVFSTTEDAPATERNNVCVYANPTENQTNDYGQWMLLLHSEYKETWLKFFSRWKNGQFNKRMGNDLINALNELGVQELKATEVTLDCAGNEKHEAQYRA